MGQASEGEGHGARREGTDQLETNQLVDELNTRTELTDRARAKGTLGQVAWMSLSRAQNQFSY